MSESIIHLELVKRLEEYVKHALLKDKGIPVLVDYPSYGIQSRPPKIGRHIPDLFVEDKTREMLIIGEAKTSHDIETERSENQLKDFIEFCFIHKNAILVVAVPWYKNRFAKSQLKRLKYKLGYETVKSIIIENLPG